MEAKLEGQENNSPLAGVRKYTHLKWAQLCGRGLAANVGASQSTATVKITTVKNAQRSPRALAGMETGFPLSHPHLNTRSDGEVLACGM